jgi:hypothetical protein
VFAEQFDDHARRGACAGCRRRPVLPARGRDVLAVR